MEEEYIDTRNIAQNLERARARLIADPAISDRNKELVESFLRDAALGKTVIGRARKKIGSSTQLSYVLHLRILVEFLAKDLDVVSERDMERFVEALDADRIRSRKQGSLGEAHSARVRL